MAEAPLRRSVSPASAQLLDRLFRSERPKLVRYARARGRWHDDPHDLVQDAFVRLAATDPDTLKGKAEAYLQRIVSNLTIDRARRAKTSPEIEAIASDWDKAVVEPSQSEGMEADDLRRRLREALAELPDRTQTVFTMHRIEELPYKAIANRIGISIKAVEYHMQRALVHLDYSLRR